MQNSRTGATSQLRAPSAASDDAAAIARIVGLALACGAADAGGPLDARELELARSASRVDPCDVRAVREAILDGDDPLGEAFLAARSHLRRRSDGAFYTGRSMRRAMLDWAMQFAPDRLVDPGCGSGRFTADALRTRPNLAVLAIDVDPVATLMTRAAVATLRAPNARVLRADYVSVALEVVSGRTAFVGNPPYVRHHDLDPRVKRFAKSLADGAGLHASALAGLHAWFFAATALRHAKPGDVGALVTSAQWLDANYGSIVRDLLRGPMGGRAITTFDAGSSPFDAMTTATIATFEVGRTVESMRFATLDASARRFELERGVVVDADALRGSQRWSNLVLDCTSNDVPGTSIGSSFRVSRGQVTGDNGFFVMTRERASALEILDFCVPVLARAREVFDCDGVVAGDACRRVALRVPGDLDLSSVPALARYLAQGEARGVHSGYIASRRRPWYSVAYSHPPIVATYMARRPPQFAYNPNSLGILNVFHGLYPRAAMTPTDLQAAVRRLNSMSAAFEQRGRVYHGGLRKFEPSDLAAVRFDWKA